MRKRPAPQTPPASDPPRAGFVDTRPPSEPATEWERLSEQEQAAGFRKLFPDTALGFGEDQWRLFAEARRAYQTANPAFPVSRDFVRSRCRPMVAENCFGDLVPEGYRMRPNIMMEAYDFAPPDVRLSLPDVRDWLRNNMAEFRDTLFEPVAPGAVATGKRKRPPSSERVELLAVEILKVSVARAKTGTGKREAVPTDRLTEEVRLFVDGAGKVRHRKVWGEIIKPDPERFGWDNEKAFREWAGPRQNGPALCRRVEALLGAYYARNHGTDSDL